MNLNKAFLLGRITQEPETRSLPSGQSVVNLSLATNRVFTDQAGSKQEQAEFHNIVAFGKLADICSKYLQKGQLVFFEGRIQTRSWVGKDGQKRYRTEVVAENMQMGPKAGGSGYNRDGAKNETPDSSPANDEEIPVIDADEEEKINVDDIPF